MFKNLCDELPFLTLIIVFDFDSLDCSMAYMFSDMVVLVIELYLVHSYHDTANLSIKMDLVPSKDRSNQS